MNTKLFLSLIFTLFTLNTSFGAEVKSTHLMVSVDNQIITMDQVEKAVSDLVIRDFNTSHCFAETDLVEYIPYDQVDGISYYGVAILELRWSCDQNANNLLEMIISDKRYTIWANPSISGFPAFSGGNKSF